MRVYKYRSLHDDTALARIMHTLQAGEFWCSRFWELNDPMEGVYRLQNGSPCYRKVFSLKASRAICSFSGAETLRSPLLWGYYANGFKGVAIGVRPDQILSKMTYSADIACPDTAQSVHAQVHAVLCNKLRPWRHEKEYRFFVAGQQGWHKVGEIDCVVLGEPYPAELVDPDQGEEHMVHLNEYRERLRVVAACAQSHGYRVHTATINGSRVKVRRNANPII